MADGAAAVAEDYFSPILCSTRIAAQKNIAMAERTPDGVEKGRQFDAVIPSDQNSLYHLHTIGNLDDYFEITKPMFDWMDIVGPQRPYFSFRKIGNTVVDSSVNISSILKKVAGDTAPGAFALVPFWNNLQTDSIEKRVYDAYAEEEYYNLIRVCVEGVFMKDIKVYGNMRLKPKQIDGEYAPHDRVADIKFQLYKYGSCGIEEYLEHCQKTSNVVWYMLDAVKNILLSNGVVSLQYSMGKIEKTPSYKDKLSYVDIPPEFKMVEHLTSSYGPKPRIIYIEPRTLPLSHYVPGGLRRAGRQKKKQTSIPRRRSNSKRTSRRSASRRR